MDRRVASHGGGRVFSFASQARVDPLGGYYVQPAKASGASSSRTVAKEIILVQLNGGLPETKARLYAAVQAVAVLFLGF
jgi:hypothetical protein